MENISIVETRTTTGHVDIPPVQSGCAVHLINKSIESESNTTNEQNGKQPCSEELPIKVPSEESPITVLSADSADYTQTTIITPHQTPSISTLKRRVTYLKKRPQPEQRTEAWYSQRQTKVTASEAASCLFLNEYTVKPFADRFGVTDMKINPNKCANPYMSKDAYVMKKCDDYFSETGGSSYRDNIFTLWGKKYEDIANRLYCLLKGTHVHEFGLICHQNVKWLAASPDGITSDGVMIEIKCPKSRKITEVPPFYYWIQVQIQLEVCNLYQCDFLQCEIIELDNEEAFLSYPLGSNLSNVTTGILIETTLESGSPSYIYPPIVNMDPITFLAWAKDTASSIDENLCPRLCFFAISNYNIIEIPRDIDWFNAVKGDIKSVWDQVTAFQKDQSAYNDFKASYLSRKNRHVSEPVNTVCLID